MENFKYRTVKFPVADSKAVDDGIEEQLSKGWEILYCYMAGSFIYVTFFTVR